MRPTREDPLIRGDGGEAAAAYRQALLQLSQLRYGPQQNLPGTWQTNGLPINHEVGVARHHQPRAGEQEGGRRICHRVPPQPLCAPNCHAEWNGELGRETVHALADIPAGQELTICYLPPGGMEGAAAGTATGRARLRVPLR